MQHFLFGQVNVPVPLEAVPADGESSQVYYIICAVFFLICGLVCGYFIWRRGHMQMLDAEQEVVRAKSELEALRKDIDEEESGLGGGSREPKEADLAEGN